MLPALKTLKGLIKTKSYHIDLPFFRLHYQATVCLLMAFCLILTAKVMFGDTIDCSSRAKLRNDIYDNMCYAIGTYTRYRVMNEGKVSQVYSIATNITFRVDPDSKYLYSSILIGDGPIKTFWHTYYQYIPIVLFLQAVLFYFPHYLWKIWEAGMVSSICKRLHDNRFSPTEYLESNYDMIYYLQNCFKLNKSLVYKYYFCHVLLLLNIVIQIIGLDIMLNNQFLFYGYMVFNFMFVDADIYGIRLFNANKNIDGHLARNPNNPMDVVFPKITSCQLSMASMAGKRPDSFDFICVLPLNILHDKFYLLLWFWFLILAVLTLIQIIQDLLFTTLPFFRRYLFRRRYGSCAWQTETRNSASLSELFLLDLIGSNSDKFAFTALLRKLNKEDWTASPSENQSIV